MSLSLVARTREVGKSRGGRRLGRWRTAEKKFGRFFEIVEFFPFDCCKILWITAEGLNNGRRGGIAGAMANFARPVASSIAGIDFGVYSNEDVKAISVKRIHNTPTLDSFNNPVPGGLYDPALGAWGDHV